MASASAAIVKIPTQSPQPARRSAAAQRPKAGRPSNGKVLAHETRAATRGDGEVIELEFGITVYPPRKNGGRWRAVWLENGERKQCESVSEEKLAAKLAKVKERLGTGAANMLRPGADLIAWYLNLDRLPVAKRWSRKHAHTQGRLCELYAKPVIAEVTSQDITVDHMQRIVNAAPTEGEGERVRRMVSAMVNAGLDAGYLSNSRLAKVHWQPGDRALAVPRASVAGESELWVGPSEIPSGADVDRLGKALAAGHSERDELMEQLAAYSGLRWGEEIALTVPQVDLDGRAITVDRKIVDIAGTLYLEIPKGRKRRKTIYPRVTPSGYPLADKLAARVEEVLAEQEAALGLLFPSPQGKYLRSSNFNRRVLQPAYLVAGWRDGTENEDEDDLWIWHSLRHVFCTAALFVWKLDATDVSRMAGHANYRTTIDMYVGTTAGVLDRARAATE